MTDFNPIDPSDEPSDPGEGDTARARGAEFESERRRSGGFALLVIAVLVSVGGVVYLYGASQNAANETAAAEASAEEALQSFNPDEFVSDFDSTPDSLPLVDETTTTEQTVATDPPTTATTTPAPGPHPGVAIDPDDIVLAFVDRTPGDSYGRVGYIDRTGERHLTQLECARLDLNESAGLCLSVSSGLTGRGQGLVTDAALVPNESFSLNSPSRATVSPDGDVVAWTGFTLGHSYLEVGEFATITQLISVERRLAANLETAFSLPVEGSGYGEASDRNYWGVSFVDSDRFYATIGSGGTTSIVEGTVSSAQLGIVFENASCPEISPDGSTIVAKEQRGEHFQLVAIDVATGSRRDLAEAKSVDDQVEWIDDDTIVYGLPNPDQGTEAQPAYDVWALDLTEESTEEGDEEPTPRLLVPFADSPAA